MNDLVNLQKMFLSLNIAFDNSSIGLLILGYFNLKKCFGMKKYETR